MARKRELFAHRALVFTAAAEACWEAATEGRRTARAEVCLWFGNMRTQYAR